MVEWAFTEGLLVKQHSMVRGFERPFLNVLISVLWVKGIREIEITERIGLVRLQVGQYFTVFQSIYSETSAGG